MNLRGLFNKSDGNTEPSAWFWRLPFVAVAMLVGIVTLFIWVGLGQEYDERRAGLVSDTLWMEQNLRVQLESTEDALAQIGNEFGLGGDLHSDQAQDKVRSLLQGPSGLMAILWLDSYGNMISTLPASSAPVLLSNRHDLALSRARALNKPAYSAPYVLADGSHAVEVIVPVFGANDFSGYAVGVYSLNRLIDKQVPWWFAERYRLAVRDIDGKEIAGTSPSGVLNESLSFKVNIDRVGGIEIQVDAYRATTRVMPLIVVAILIGFAMIIAWSFWMLRRHLLRLRHTEEALRREYAFRLAMENSTMIGLWACNVDGRITYVNSAFCRMLGWTESELLGTSPPMPFWHPDEARFPDLTRQRPSQHLIDEPTPPVETRFQRKNGQVFDVLAYEAPLISADGRQTGWMGSVLDVTERKRAEALARSQQERLESTARLVTMGEMASTLAHEINQPLSAIASYSAGCLNALRGGRFDAVQFDAVLGKINHQAQRAGRIVHRIYGFVRRNESRREQLQINSAVLEAAGLVEAEAARRKVRIQLELGEDLPAIEGDGVMIEQVLINLLRNAMDATHDTPEPERLLRVRSESVGNSAVRVAVIDRGCGIPAENADKLYDSFFTTKPEGMGMGLKICRSVAEQHNGRLWFEAAEGGGTAFYLQLPALKPNGDPPPGN